MPLDEPPAPPNGRRMSRSWLRRGALIVAALLVGLVAWLPGAAAQGLPNAASSAPPTRSLLSAADPLNGGFLIVNMHGMLFHPAASDIDEDVAYARWLGGGVIRVFATDNNGPLNWSGKTMGDRIADIAPSLRAGQTKLIVALVNNHREVPGELPSSSGWMDNYWQLLLPFYTTNWRGAYLTFVRDLISTVRARGAHDVIFAWELGNELHTPTQPTALMDFITSAVDEVRLLDPGTPILPGTMGANHVEPGNRQSPIARWLYCEAPIDAYTLHAYDFIGRNQPGDMPIDWDLDNITSQPCPDGRRLPVIVEELGTSRALPGLYTSDDELGRLRQEVRQIEFVRQFREVIGFGVWNGESPRLVDRTFVDVRRGLTSYGARAMGGGSCYDPMPESAPGVRCLLEQVLRGVRFVRVDATDRWAAGSDANVLTPLSGSVDPIATDSTTGDLTLSGWVMDPSNASTPGVDALNLFVGTEPRPDGWLAAAQLGLARFDVPLPESQGPPNVGFQVSVPLQRVPPGTNVLTLVARSAERGTWQTAFQVVVPRLGPIAPAAPRPAPLPLPPDELAVARPHIEVQAPSPAADVPRHFTVQVLAPGADRVDVFLEPGRDRGGRLAGSTPSKLLRGGSFQVPVNAPSGPQSVYVHAHYATGAEAIVTLPLTVN
jgi:hypothetical protein